MDFLEIIIQKQNLIRNNLSDEIIIQLKSNLVIPTNYNILKTPEGILFEPHVNTFMLLMSIWFLEEFFYYLFWIDYIKPLREKLKCYLQNKFRKIKNSLFHY